MVKNWDFIQERRKWIRVNVQYFIRHKQSDIQQDWEVSQINNLGQGGCMFISSRGYEKNTKLEIQITVPFIREPLQLTALVMWSSKMLLKNIYKIGVFFEVTDPQIKTKIGKAVEFLIRKKIQQITSK